MEPNVPTVDGLEITPVGQQSSMQVINGAVSAEVRYMYQVTPNRSGNFTIPAIGVPGGGSTQPIAFRVDKTPSGQNSRSPRPGGSPLPAPSFTRRRRTPRRRTPKASRPSSAWCCPNRNSPSANWCPWN